MEYYRIETSHDWVLGPTAEFYRFVSNHNGMEGPRRNTREEAVADGENHAEILRAMMPQVFSYENARRIIDYTQCVKQREVVNALWSHNDASRKRIAELEKEVSVIKPKSPSEEVLDLAWAIRQALGRKRIRRKVWPPAMGWYFRSHGGMLRLVRDGSPAILYWQDAEATDWEVAE